MPKAAKRNKISKKIDRSHQPIPVAMLISGYLFSGIGLNRSSIKRKHVKQGIHGKLPVCLVFVYTCLPANMPFGHLQTHYITELVDREPPDL
jgi:hypothetical protein